MRTASLPTLITYSLTDLSCSPKRSQADTLRASDGSQPLSSQFDLTQLTSATADEQVTMMEASTAVMIDTVVTPLRRWFEEYQMKTSR